MNCPIEHEILVAYAAGELDPESARAVEQHLAGCSSCRSMAADQDALWKALDAWEAPQVSPDFDRRLYCRIDEGLRLSWWERLTRAFRPIPIRQALPLAATAGLLLMAGLLLHQPSQPVPVAPRGESVRADQVETTLDDLDLLRQFSLANPESPHPDAM